MVRAKFRCHFKHEGVVKLSPVTSGSPENETFYSYTPWGEVVLGIVSGNAAEQFEIGKEYYVDFSVAQ